MKRVSMDELRRRARSMRRGMTEAELVLWSALRASPSRVLRQRILYPFIVDFYAPEERLVIEVDGPVHDDRRAYDARRDAYLRCRYGVRISRFGNDDVLGDLGRVLRSIDVALGLR